MSTRTEYRDRLITTLADLATAREQIKVLREALEACVFALEIEKTRELSKYESSYGPLRTHARRALDETK